MSIKQNLSYLFNWKKHPASVFHFVFPLFLVGMTLFGLLAYYQWKFNNDPVYFFIVLGGVALLGFGLWPLRHQLKEYLK